MQVTPETVPFVVEQDFIHRFLKLLGAWKYLPTDPSVDDSIESPQHLVAVRSFFVSILPDAGVLLDLDNFLVRLYIILLFLAGATHSGRSDDPSPGVLVVLLPWIL